MEEAKDLVKKALEECERNHITEWAAIKTNIKDVLRRILI